MQLACNMSDISDFVQEIVPAYRCVHTPDKFPDACVHGSWGGQSWSFIAGEEGEMPNGYGRLINPDPGRSARSLARSLATVQWQAMLHFNSSRQKDSNVLTSLT